MNVDTDTSAPPLTRQQALLRLAKGMQADVADYGVLRDLLEAQFALALRHDTDGLAEIAGRISTLCETLGGRHRERRQLVDLFSGPRVSPPRKDVVAALIAQLPATYRAMAELMWTSLGLLVKECKALNSRNCQLMMAQHDIMQRVLGGESDVYVAD